MTRLSAAWAWVYRSPSRAAVALRTAVQTFAGVLAAAWVKDGDGRVSTIPDIVGAGWDFAAGSALLAALLALGWHAKRSAP